MEPTIPPTPMGVPQYPNKAIRFRVVTVTKKASAEVSTIHYTYKKAPTESAEVSTNPKHRGYIGPRGEDNIERESSRTEGAEWEEIEFTVEHEEQPTIQIANVIGNAFLVGQSKLIVNNPDLFGMYKVGDVIEFISQRAKEEKTETDLVALANSLVKASN